MYKTYATLKDHFGGRLRMGYTDTDALILIVASDDLYVELKSQPQLRDLIDFSSIPSNHPSGVGEPDDPRSGVVGYFKDECSGNIITEFVALKPKAYSFTTCPPTLYDPARLDAPAPPVKSKQDAKGIARSIIKQKLRHETYLEMFREGPLQRLPNRAIRSKLYQVYSLEVNKRGLHPSMTNDTYSQIWRTGYLIHTRMRSVTILSQVRLLWLMIHRPARLSWLT